MLCSRTCYLQKKRKKKDILCLEKHQTNFNLILKEVIIFKIPRIIIIIFIIRAGNNFCLFTGHISFQIFLSLRQFTNWTWHNVYWLGCAGMVQWWEHSPPTNVAWVRFPDLASYVGWVCWFSTLRREVFSENSGFPGPLLQKPKFDLIVLISSANENNPIGICAL